MQYTTNATPTFETFYDRHVALVRRVLSRQYANHASALDDLVQETFFRAWKAYERLDHSQNVTGWICRIAHNVAREFIRHTTALYGKDCLLETDDGKVIDLADSRQDEPVALIEASDSIAHVYGQLCSEDQHVMALLFQQYTPKEIGAVLHLDKPTCWTRIQRARRRFQRLYAQA